MGIVQSLKVFMRLKLPKIYNLLNVSARYMTRGPSSFYGREDRYRFMRCAFHVLHFNNITGDYVEFGSHGCMTFTLADREIKLYNIDRHLWAFDSFEGLPPNATDEDYHPVWNEGKMSTSLDEFNKICARNSISKNNYTAVPGFYDVTLTSKAKNKQKMPDDIALAYIDCDLLSSTRDVLTFLKPRLKHGMILAFDDYFNYSDKLLSGERKASQEFFNSNNEFSFLPYIQYGYAGQSFIVEDKKLLEDLS